MSSILFSYRHSALQTFNHLAACRRASSSANPFPYPLNSNPSPHQIFHLPRTASHKDVKARYYELVRIYHPDSPVARLVPPETAQSRFHAITTAYDILRGKSKHTIAGEPERPKKDYHDLSTAMWRAKQHRKADLNVGLDDRWKDGFLLGMILLAVGAWVAQTYTARSKAVSTMLEKSESRPRFTSNPPPTKLPSRKEYDEDSALSADGSNGS